MQVTCRSPPPRAPGHWTYSPASDTQGLGEVIASIKHSFRYNSSVKSRFRKAEAMMKTKPNRHTKPTEAVAEKVAKFLRKQANTLLRA